MKIVENQICVVVVVVCVCVCCVPWFCVPYFYLLEELRALSFECKSDQFYFTDWMSSCHLISRRNLSLIQKLSTQTPNAFNQYGIAKKMEKILQNMITATTKKQNTKSTILSTL